MRQESLIRLLSQSLFRLREAFERHQTLAVLAGMLPVLGVIVILTRDRTLVSQRFNRSKAISESCWPIPTQEVRLQKWIRANDQSIAKRHSDPEIRKWVSWLPNRDGKSKVDSKDLWYLTSAKPWRTTNHISSTMGLSENWWFIPQTSFVISWQKTGKVW